MAARRTAYQRRGRAALLGVGIVFVAVQLAAGLLLDWRGLAVRFPSAARVLAAAPRDGHGPDVLLLGSSRFEQLSAGEAGVLLHREHPDADPEGVYNAAVPAGDPIVEDFLLERLLRQGSRPRLAVVEISPETVNEYNVWFTMHAHRQITWRDTPACFVEVCRADEFKRLVRARLVPLYAHRRELRRQALAAVTRPISPPPAPARRSAEELFGGSLPSVGPDGRLPWETLLQVARPPLTPAEAEARAAFARTTWKRFKDYQPGGTTAAALERLLQRCRANDIEVVLVGVPNDSYFLRQCTPDINATYLDYVGRLTRTYGCRFIDYRDAEPDQLFVDSNHLNGEGASHFVRRLTRDVISPWWQERQAAYARRSDDT